MSDPLEKFFTPRERARLARTQARFKRRLERFQARARRRFSRFLGDNPATSEGFEYSSARPSSAAEMRGQQFSTDSMKGYDPMNHPTSLARKRGFYRSNNSIFFGVCAGLAEYFDFAPWGVRLFFLILQFTVAPYMFLVYAVLALIMKRVPRPVQFSNYADEDFYYAYQNSRSEALRKAKNAFDALDRRMQRMEDVVTDRKFGLEEEYRNL